MRAVLNSLVVALLIVGGIFLARCGSVSVSNLDPAEFNAAATPTATPTP